ncbi:MAG: hypothetical protein Q8O33_15740 [Pseudomonadota bacterium]|nr:hypothetical protein [Pseudomonadota bacterium]
MTRKTKGRAGWHQATQKTSDSQEFTQKPDIDLLSWAALGGDTKPSRIDRKQKRTWKRRAGK